MTGVIGEIGRRYNDDPWQRVIFTDSHDTAANGSARLNELIAPGKSASLHARRQSLIAATLLLTAPGIPMLLQGQEFMMGGSFSDWLALDWSLAETWSGIVDAHRHLISLRKNVGGVSAGLVGKSVNLFHVDEDNKVIAYHRWSQGGPHDDVVVVVNFGEKLHTVYGINFPRSGTWRVRFNSAAKVYSEDFSGEDVPDAQVVNGGADIVLPANSAVIFSQD
jgi:1,4-alpha-glucan branching enzyme